MSGLTLRALLEGSHLSLDLKASGATPSPSASQESVSKVLSPTFASYDASRAYLNRTNIWDAPEVDGGFNLEYMDLEEFLQETGLETLDRTSIFPASPAASVASSTGSDLSNGCHSVASAAAVPIPVASSLCSQLSQGAAVMPTTLSRAAQAIDTEQHTVASAPAVPADLSFSQQSSPASTSCEVSSCAESVNGSLTVTDVPEKTPYSNVPSRTLVQQQQQQRSAPVTDLTSAVVCIPGKEGFDPESHKFAPEELVPQPIIKKSRKVYVPDEQKDDRYWARRKKNNSAAKRSRDARRAKENQIIMRAAFLEQHNDELSLENKRLLEENKALTAAVQAYKQRLGEK